MKKFWQKLWKVGLATLAALGVFAMANQPANAATNKDGKNKVLIVYFSRTKGVYNGPLKVGNTKRIADDIQKRTGGTEYEIVPKKPYPSSYNKTTQVARREQRNNARPAIKNKLPNVKKYSTVFIGSPIWWSQYPMIVRTFMDKEPALNSSSKTVIPFTTAEGSGLGNTTQTLRKSFPKAHHSKGFTVRGSQASRAQGKVNSWLKGLGY